MHLDDQTGSTHVNTSTHALSRRISPQAQAQTVHMGASARISSQKMSMYYVMDSLQVGQPGQPEQALDTTLGHSAKGAVKHSRVQSRDALGTVQQNLPVCSQKDRFKVQAAVASFRMQVGQLGEDLMQQDSLCRISPQSCWAKVQQGGQRNQLARLRRNTSICTAVFCDRGGCIGAIALSC